MALDSNYTINDVEYLADDLLDYWVEVKDVGPGQTPERPVFMVSLDISEEQHERFETLIGEETYQGSRVCLMKDIYNEVAENYSFEFTDLSKAEMKETGKESVTFNSSHSMLNYDPEIFAEEVVKKYARQADIDFETLNRVAERTDWEQ